MPTLGELRAILDSQGRPICSSSGGTICGNCPPPRPCCLCQDFAPPYIYSTATCFALTGDDGTFDPQNGQTTVARLNYFHGNVDPKGRPDPFLTFDPCVRDGYVWVQGTTTIAGKATCYRIFLRFGFWCDEAGQLRATWLGPLYYRAWENDTCRYLEFGPNYCCYDPPFPSNTFTDLGVVTWSCNYSEWSDPKTISVNLAWKDPRTGGSHSIPASWTLKVAALDPTSEAFNLGRCPPHTNQDDDPNACPGFLSDFNCSNYYPDPFQYQLANLGVLQNHFDPFPPGGGYLCCDLWALIPGQPGFPDYGQDPNLPPLPSAPDGCCPNDMATVAPILPSTITPGGNCATCGLYSSPFRWLSGIGPNGEAGYMGFVVINRCGGDDPGGFIILKMICQNDDTWLGSAIGYVNGSEEGTELSLIFAAPCNVSGCDYHFTFTLILNPNPIQLPCHNGLFIDVGYATC